MGQRLRYRTCEPRYPAFFRQHNKDLLYGVTELPNIASQKVLLKCGLKKKWNLQRRNAVKEICYVTAGILPIIRFYSFRYSERKYST